MKYDQDKSDSLQSHEIQQSVKEQLDYYLLDEEIKIMKEFFISRFGRPEIRR